MANIITPYDSNLVLINLGIDTLLRKADRKNVKNILAMLKEHEATAYVTGFVVDGPFFFQNNDYYHIDLVGAVEDTNSDKFQGLLKRLRTGGINWGGSEFRVEEVIDYENKTVPEKSYQFELFPNGRVWHLSKRAEIILDLVSCLDIHAYGDNDEVEDDGHINEDLN